MQALRNLGEPHHRRAPIIVETSAVADVATLEQTLMAHPALRRVVTLDGVVTTGDAGAWCALAGSPDPLAPALAVAAGADVVLYRPDGDLIAAFAFHPGTVNALASADQPARLAAGFPRGSALALVPPRHRVGFPRSEGATLALR